MTENCEKICEKHKDSQLIKIEKQLKKMLRNFLSANQLI